MQNPSKNIASGGGPPPRFRNNIFWQILHTFCLLFNLFWNVPLKSIGFLRFQLIFRWFFNDFNGFSVIFKTFCSDFWPVHCRTWKISTYKRLGPIWIITYFELSQLALGYYKRGCKSRSQKTKDWYGKVDATSKNTLFRVLFKLTPLKMWL